MCLCVTFTNLGYTELYTAMFVGKVPALSKQEATAAETRSWCATVIMSHRQNPLVLQRDQDSWAVRVEVTTFQSSCKLVRSVR